MHHFAKQSSIILSNEKSTSSIIILTFYRSFSLTFRNVDRFLALDRKFIYIFYLEYSVWISCMYYEIEIFVYDFSLFNIATLLYKTSFISNKVLFLKMILSNLMMLMNRSMIRDCYRHKHQMKEDGEKAW